MGDDDFFDSATDSTVGAIGDKTGSKDEIDNWLDELLFEIDRELAFVVQHDDDFLSSSSGDSLS